MSEGEDRRKGTVAVIVGTRPEVVKLAGIIRLLGDRAVVVHTGQHYDPELAAEFSAALFLPEPAVQLHIGGGTRDEQLTAGTTAVAEVLSDLAPEVVVVQGDTNSTLAGARAAVAVGIPLVHVEAGLRSFDKAMPEEHNRIETDHLADLCLAPTEWAAEHLANEGIGTNRVVVTGNTAVDAVLAALPVPDRQAEVVSHLGLTPRSYILGTIHRPENTDDPGVLALLLDSLAALPRPVVFPLHPRTHARISDAGLEPVLDRLRVVPPLGHADFLSLAAHCALLVSDSGGIQEEASVLKRPVVVVRRSTERPEVEGTFARLVRPADLTSAAMWWLDELDRDPDPFHGVPSPYGDGRSSERCVAAIDNLLAAVVR
jgi:UDP-N-acetylglucosamine 2-epimerase (non-hydrolysing)